MKKVTRRSKKLYTLNKKLRIFIILASIILLVSMIISLSIVLKNDKFIYKKKSLYSYSNKAKVDYIVTLKPNAYDLFEGQKVLGQGNTYINDFVDEIKPSLTYEFSGEQSAEINGNYQVYGIIEGSINNDKGSKTVWQKKVIIQDKTSFNSNSNKAEIKANSHFKLEDYRQLIDKAIKGLNVHFDIKFTVYWNIQMTAKTDKGMINENICPTMEIPLYSDTFVVGGQLSQEKNGAIETTEKIQAPIDKNMEILSVTLMIVSLFSLVFFSIFTTSNIPDDPLKKKIKKIFKEHGDRLVNLRNSINISNQVPICVAGINDLVRVSDEISRPILYIQDENSNQVTKFYVLDEKDIYLYEVGED